METPTIEMLIIVDQSVNESSKLLDPKIYDSNSNVKIVSPNGRWCLSENDLEARSDFSPKYVRPRVFKKACR